VADLTTLARVKLRLFPDGSTDTDADTLLAQLITDCSAYVNAFVNGRQLTPLTAQTIYLDTAPGSVIQYPPGIRTVTSLSVAIGDQPDDGTGTYTAVAAADIYLRGRLFGLSTSPATLIYLQGSYARLRLAFNGAKLVGDTGWAATPADIQSVVDDAVTVAYTSRQGPADSGIGEGSAPSYPWARYFGKDSAARKTLERYRRPGMA